MADQTVTLRLKGDGSSAQAAVKGVSADIKGMGTAAQTAGAQASASVKRIGDEAKRASDFVKGLVGAFVSFQGARALISLADQAAGLNARLRLATDSSRAFNIAQAETFSIAQRTSTALASTVQLYARLQQSTEGLGVSQGRLLALTETINQTFIVSGTSAANQANAITQLTQAFAGGVLRAEEFNSIIENSPRLAKAFADGLGVSTGALRKMVNDGEVDVARMIAALESQSEAIQAEFETMPVTIGQAWVQVQNAVLKYIGDADSATGVSRELAQAIKSIADNFASIAPVIGTALAAMAGWVALATPLGRVATAAAAIASAFVWLESVTDDAGEAAAETDRIIKDLNTTMGASRVEAIKQAESQRVLAREFLTTAQAALESARAQQAAAALNLGTGTARDTGGRNNALARAQVQEALEMLAAAEGRLAALNTKLGEMRFDAVVGGFRSTAAAAANATTNVDKTTKSAKDNETATRAMADAWADLVEEQRELAKASEDADRWLADLLAKNRDLAEEISGVSESQREMNRELEQVDALTVALTDSMGDLNEADRRRIEAILTQITEGARLRDELGRQAEAERMVEQAAEDAARAQEERYRQLEAVSADVSYSIVEQWRGDGEALKNMVKRYIDQMIAEFLRLRVIQPLLGSLFGGAGGGFGGLIGAGASALLGGGGGGAAAASGGGTSWGGLASMFGGGQGGGGSLMSPSTWANAGRNLYSGFSQAWQGSGRVMNGSQMFGQSVYGPGMQTGFAPTGLGYAAGIAGGLYAGYGRWQNNEPGAGRYAGAAAYGLGTYTGAMALGGIASGAGAAAGVAGGFGAMGAAAAVPVIGWVALIAMVIDAVSGGKLFGTAYKPDEYQSTLGITAAGGTARMQVREERQTALFGGRRARYRDLDVTPEMQRAADEFYRGIVGLHEDAARRLSLSELAPIIEGSFTQVFDAYDDNPLKKEFGEILGRTFEEPIEQFKNRLAGANILSAIAAALSADQIGAGRFAGYGNDPEGGGDGSRVPIDRPGTLLKALSDTIEDGADRMGEAAHSWDESFAAVMAIAERWDATGDEFLDGAQFLLTAASDMVNGFALLGEGGTLSDIADLIEDLRGEGEALAATYDRVKASTAQLELALEIMGQSLDLKREQFVRFAVDITEAAGGVERAGQLWNDFFTNFYGQAELAALQIDGLLAQRDTSLASVGLSPDTTMAEFRQAFEAGIAEMTAAEVVRWLEVGAVLAQATQVQREYALAVIDSTNSLETIMLGVDQALGAVAGGSVVDWQAAMRDLEQANTDLIARAIQLGASEEELARIRQFAALRVEDLIEAQQFAAQEYQAFVAQFNESRVYASAINQIRAQEQAAIRQANTLARAAGMQGAAERDLVAIHRWAAREIAAIMAELTARIQDIAAELYGPSLGRIEEQIRALEQASVGGIGEVEAAVEDRYARELQQLQQLDQFIQGLMTGPLSPLSPREQMEAAQAEYERLLALVQAGDLDALAQLQGAAQTYLQLAQGFFGGVGEYEAIFGSVTTALQALVDRGPQNGEIAPGFGGQQGGGVSAELAALYAERDALMAEQEALHRAELARQLVEHMAEWAELSGRPVLELIESMEISLTDLATDLGVNLQDLTGESVRILGEMATALGIPLGELVAGLGLELPALADGVRELAAELGINLGLLTTGTAAEIGAMVTQLGGLSSQLGLDLYAMAELLGIELGSLADVNSPIYQGLQDLLGGLPDGIGTDLQPYLDDIVNATTRGTQADAMRAAAEYISTLDADIAAALAPFFPGVTVPPPVTELDYLSDVAETNNAIRLIAEDQRTLLQRAVDNLASLADGQGFPSYAVGTGYVPQTGLATIHRGEAILPAPFASWLRAEGFPMAQGGGGEALAAEVRALRAELAQLREERQQDANTAADQRGRIVDAQSETARQTAKIADRAAL